MNDKLETNEDRMRASLKAAEANPEFVAVLSSNDEPGVRARITTAVVHAHAIAQAHEADRGTPYPQVAVGTEVAIANLIINLAKTCLKDGEPMPLEEALEVIFENVAEKVQFGVFELAIYEAGLAEPKVPRQHFTFDERPKVKQ